MSEITCKKCGNTAHILTSGIASECPVCGFRELDKETWADLYAEFYEIEDSEEEPEFLNPLEVY